MYCIAQFPPQARRKAYSFRVDVKADSFIYSSPLIRTAKQRFEPGEN